jgi:hypothetical protein
MHGIDPAGAAGYQRYLQEPHIRNARLTPGRDLIAARQSASVRHDFLELLAEQTGGRPVTDNDDLEAAVAGIFEEYGSYYLLGYETTNGDPDGKFRGAREVRAMGARPWQHGHERWATVGTLSVRLLAPAAAAERFSPRWSDARAAAAHARGVVPGGSGGGAGRRAFQRRRDRGGFDGTYASRRASR